MPIPPHHRRVPLLLSAGSLLGVAILAYGLVVLDVWAALAGTILAAGAKLWFVDRMAWLYDETRATPPTNGSAGDRSGGCGRDG